MPDGLTQTLTGQSDTAAAEQQEKQQGEQEEGHKTVKSLASTTSRQGQQSESQTREIARCFQMSTQDRERAERGHRACGSEQVGGRGRLRLIQADHDQRR